MFALLRFTFFGSEMCNRFFILGLVALLWISKCFRCRGLVYDFDLVSTFGKEEGEARFSYAVIIPL